MRVVNRSVGREVMAKDAAPESSSRALVRRQGRCSLRDDALRDGVARFGLGRALDHSAARRARRSRYRSARRLDELDRGAEKELLDAVFELPLEVLERLNL